MTTPDVTTIIDKLAEKLAAVADKLAPVVPTLIAEFQRRQMMYVICFGVLAVGFILVAVAAERAARIAGANADPSQEADGFLMGVSVVSPLIALIMLSLCLYRVALYLSPCLSLLEMLRYIH